MKQPLDVDTWYANRLRVAVTGPTAQGAHVRLLDADGNLLPSSETLGHVALLHADPPPGAIVADVQVQLDQLYDLLAAWPDAEASQVTRYRFEGVPPGPSGHASLTLRPSASPALVVEGASQQIAPPSAQVEAATWDAPDLVWLAGMLPATDVVRGVTISLLAGLLPTALYVGVMYWADRYEKEPRAMVAAAFLWGAIPALLVAVAVRLFVRLPVELLGPEALQAVRAGLLAPLVEEALKGAVVLFIALRYRLEFDNLLDGIVYGAVVGFGFAMTGNVISYLGAFLLRGFAGLSITIFVEGVLYGLNHALYAAVFGAGLGYARLAQQRWQRWAIPLAAFVLAMVLHALHNLAIHNAIGLSLWTVAATWLGVLVIVVVIVWSLRRERHALATELRGEVPDEVYQAMTVRGGRFRAQWQALRWDGLSRWRQARRLYQQCAELATKKMQRRRRPDETRLRDEVDRLRKEIRSLVGGKVS
jgi:RsiW-degrading membrane proteinase PrsW (M82 family)